MAEQSFLAIEWILDSNATPEEIAAVTKITLEEDLPGQVKATLSQKGLGVDPCEIVILTSVVLFLKGFLDEAGRSSYQDLRRLISRLLSARRQGQTQIRIEERNSPTTIVFGQNHTR